MSADYDDSKETRQRLYEQTKAELTTKQIANSNSYDTAVLTLSSAFLALSLTFIKDVVAPIREATMLWLLYLSWCSYCLAIVSTVASFMVGQAGYRNLIAAAERYYIQGESEAYQLSVVVANRIEKLNVLHGSLFILGTVMTLVFSISNFNRLAAMSTLRTPASATEQRGQPITPFQKVPAPAASKPASAPPAAPAQPPAEQKAGT